MKSIPIQTAEARADFVEMALNPQHVRFLDGMVKSSRVQRDNLFPPDWNGGEVAQDMQVSARMSELFTATPDMHALMMHASKSLPPQTLERTDLPSQHGFLYLPSDLTNIDIRGEEVRTRAIMWAEREIGHPGVDANGKGLEVGRGIVIWLFTEFGSQRDSLRRAGWSDADFAKARTFIPRMSLMHCMTVGFGHIAWDIDTSGVDGDPEFKAWFGRNVMRSIHDGEVIEQQANGSWLVRTADGNIVTTKPDPVIQYLKTYFHFYGSVLSEPDREHMPRSMARWFRRLGLPDGPVTVVRLRRRPHGPETGNGWTLTYRHVRRGHWRKQWYGSGEHKFQRHIWISPTIVGPEDGELAVRDVVNLVQR